MKFIHLHLLILCLVPKKHKIQLFMSCSQMRLYLKFIKMKVFKYIILLAVMLACGTYASAQGIRIYKTDGAVIKLADSELDSIVALPKEEINKVYRSNGTVFKILYSELDSIVGIPGVNTNASFVDLGLSVKWASRNIGAENPEDFGSYFAWGEITPKTSYTKENCTTYGKLVSEFSGEAEYDAARANWGDAARIPTFEEFQELRDKCTWEWKSVNGVNGQLVTGPNGNSIFLPAAGIFRDDLQENVGEKGCYWSATPYEYDNNSAYNSLFNDGGYWGSWRSRSDGLSVRAVSGEIQCLSYTGDTLSVGEFTADVSVMFSYVPDEGVVGGVEYYSTTDGVKYQQTVEVKHDGEYTISLSGLERGNKYRYRSFVIVNEKYVYGVTEEFVTKNNEDNLTKGEWIDLGLSVKWASHNIGAALPEDYGDYYAWGEIFPKQQYDEGNSETYGEKMTDISGNSDYDAATANWGGDARVPTEAEIEELIEKCTWQWVPRNGVNGMLITGPNGNSIFIPASGFRVGAVLDSDDKNGFYWSSTPHETDNGRAYGFNFSKKGPRGSWVHRGNGRVIRPVSN